MMNYETFKEVIVARIKDFLPESFKDSEVKIHHINKVNKQLESMNIVLKDAPNLASPNIYLEDFYNNEFKKENDIDIVLQKMAGMIVEYTLELPNTMEFDFNNMTDQIVMQAVLGSGKISHSESGEKNQSRTKKKSHYLDHIFPLHWMRTNHLVKETYEQTIR